MKLSEYYPLILGYTEEGDDSDITTQVKRLEVAVEYARSLCYKHYNGDDACHCEFYNVALPVYEDAFSLAEDGEFE